MVFGLVETDILYFYEIDDHSESRIKKRPVESHFQVSSHLHIIVIKVFIKVLSHKQHL